MPCDIQGHAFLIQLPFVTHAFSLKLEAPCPSFAGTPCLRASVANRSRNLKLLVHPSPVLRDSVANPSSSSTRDRATATVAPGDSRVQGQGGKSAAQQTRDRHTALGGYGRVDWGFAEVVRLGRIVPWQRDVSCSEITAWLRLVSTGILSTIFLIAVRNCGSEPALLRFCSEPSSGCSSEPPSARNRLVFSRTP